MNVLPEHAFMVGHEGRKKGQGWSKGVHLQYRSKSKTKICSFNR